MGDSWFVVWSSLGQMGDILGSFAVYFFFLGDKQKHFLFRRNDFSKPIFPTVEICKIFYRDRKNSNQLATEFSVSDFSIWKRKS